MGGLPATLTLKGHAEGYAAMLPRVAFSPDGSRIASAGFWDKTLRLWDSGTGMELLTLLPQNDANFCVAFSPDNARLATAGVATVHVYDLASGREALSLRGHAYLVFNVAFNPKGTMIASADTHNAEVKLWDAATGRPIRSLKGDGLVGAWRSAPTAHESPPGAATMSKFGTQRLGEMCSLSRVMKATPCTWRSVLTALFWLPPAPIRR
jgi:WD40 repeat protein